MCPGRGPSPTRGAKYNIIPIPNLNCKYKPRFYKWMYPYILYALQMALSIKLIVTMELFFK
jgi:hypothetical protein